MSDLQGTQAAVVIERSLKQLRDEALSARREKDFARAHELLTEADTRFPNDLGVIHDLGRVAEEQCDWVGAAVIWRRFIACSQRPIWWAWTSLAECLYRNGDTGLAAETFAQARSLLPAEIAIYTSEIRLLSPLESKQDVDRLVALALDSISSLRNRDLIEMGHAVLLTKSLPLAVRCAKKLAWDGDEGIAAGHFLAIVKTFAADSESELLPEIDAIGKATSLMMFESLGGDYPGCEIGLVQRRFGVEPLGLLRWTTILPYQLTEALETEFAGVGTPDQTVVYIPDRTGHYKTRDKRFGMDMVTFMPKTSMDIDEMHRRSTKRISFLRRKLIDDLASKEKVFVYRTFNDSMSLAEILKLKAAMSAYGENRLLYIRLADADHKPGEIEQIADDLIIGRVAKFSPDPNNVLYLEGWLEMFEKVAKVWLGPVVTPT